MEVGGSKRSGTSAREKLEQTSNPRSENGGAALKKVYSRDTPEWVRDASGNQTGKDRGRGSGIVKDGAERLQDITTIQRSFTAGLKPPDEVKHRRVPGTGRWSAPSQTPRESSPKPDRWSTRIHNEQFLADAILARMTENITRLKVAQSGVDSSDRATVGDDSSRYDDGSSGQRRYDGTTEKKAARPESGQDFHGGDGSDGSDGCDGAGQEEKGEGKERDTSEQGEGNKVTTDTNQLLEIQGGGQGREAKYPDGASNRGKSLIGNKTSGGLVKGPWTKEEDQKIIDCITQNITKWSEIAERVEGRVGKQCRERWFNHLDPSLKKSSWTPTEDEILVQGQARFGNSWTKIAKLLPGRSENAVKNRWNSAARKKGNRAARMATKMNNALPTNGAGLPEYMTSQVHISPDQGVEHAQYFTMPPSFNPARNSRPQAPPYAGWSAPSVDMPGSMRLNTQVPQSILGALATQHRRDQRSPGDEPQRTLGPETLPEQGYGHLAADAERSYDQPVLPSTFAMGNPRRTLSPPRVAPGVLGMSRNGGARSAAVEVAAPRREGCSALLLSPPPANDQQQPSDSKEDSLSFGCEEELSLSTTLFNLCLSKTSLSGLTQSFGRPDDSRNEFDDMETSLGRQPLQDGCSGRPAPRGVVTGSGRSECPNGMEGHWFGDRWLDSCERNGATSHEQERQLPISDTSTHPRLDFATSVSDLLFAPVQPRTGEYPSPS